MSYTYHVNSASMNGGRRDSISQFWNNFQEGTGGGLIVGHSSSGYSSTYYRAVNILFSSSDLAQFSGKTITAIKLRITVSSGTLGSSGYPYRIRYKYNDVATTSKSSEAWASGNAGATDFDDTDLDTWSNGQSSGTTTISAGTTHDFDCGTTLPKYGYVIAGNTGNAYMKLATACELLVTTTETEYTLKLQYNANGGTNAPATQTKTVITTGSPSYSFTVSSSTPSRTGYEFVKWNTQANGSGTDKTGGQTITVTGTTTLYAQWNALKSTLNSISAGTIGSNLSVSWTAKGSFQHKISFTLGSSTTSPATVSAGTNSYTFAIPSSWLNQLPTTTSGTATATLQTLVDGVVIGTDSKTFTVNVASSVVPSIGTVTATKVNTNPTVEGWNIYLQSFSQVQITANTLTAGTGASLVSIKFSGQNMDTTLSVSGTSANATSNTITASGSLTYTVLLTDSRGRTASKTVTISVTAYSPPTVTFFAGWRCDADGTINPITGDSLEAQAVFTYTAVGNNAITNTLSYKKTTEQYYTTAGSNVASYAVTIFASHTADMASTYDVQFYIADSLYNSSTLHITISSVVGIAFGLKNDRARFGGAVRQAGLEVDWNAQFNGDVTVADNVKAKKVQIKGDAIYPLTIKNEDDDEWLEVITNDGHSQMSLYDEGTERNYIGQGRFSTYNTSGTEVDRVAHNGSFFGSDVTFNGHAYNSYGDISHTGEDFTPNPSAVSVPDSTWTTVGSVQVGAGTWLIMSTIRFADNGSGWRRQIVTTTATGTTANAIQNDDAKNAVDGTYTIVRGMCIHHPTSSITYYLRAYQTSGTSLSATGRIYAIRIA